MKFVSSWNFSSKQSREEGIFVKKSIYLSFTRRQLFDISCAVEVNEAKSLITPVNTYASLKNSSLNIERKFYQISENSPKIIKVFTILVTKQKKILHFKDVRLSFLWIFAHPSPNLAFARKTTL